MGIGEVCRKEGYKKIVFSNNILTQVSITNKHKSKLNLKFRNPFFLIKDLPIMTEFKQLFFHFMYRKDMPFDVMKICIL